MAAQESAAGGGGSPQVVVTRWRYGDVGDSNFAVRGRAAPLLAGLLCAVVVFAALCLYLCWRCKRHRHRYDPEAGAAALPGLDADAIRGLPVKLHRPPASPAGDDDEALCSICISALVAGEKVKVLPPCGHCFHPDCVDAWLRSHPSCPLCRRLLLLLADAKV
jgi:hypothetical protein